MNMSVAYGDFHLSKYSIFDVLCIDKFVIYDAIKSVSGKYFSNLSIRGKVDIIPANVNINKLYNKLNMGYGEERLLCSLQQLNAEDYDYILIDTSTFFKEDIVISNALYASDEVIIPVKLEEFSLIGLILTYLQIREIIDRGLNPELKINGILCTQVVESRKKVNTMLLENITNYARKKDLKVFNSYIRNISDVILSQCARESVLAPNEFEKMVTTKNGKRVKTKQYSEKKIKKDALHFYKEFIKKE